MTTTWWAKIWQLKSTAATASYSSSKRQSSKRIEKNRIYYGHPEDLKIP